MVVVCPASVLPCPPGRLAVPVLRCGGVDWGSCSIAVMSEAQTPLLSFAVDLSGNKSYNELHNILTFQSVVDLSWVFSFFFWTCSTTCIMT